MKYTSKQIESARGRITDTERRIEIQRGIIEKKLEDHHPADEPQALLLLMEHSLVSMKRYLQILERDLESEVSLHQRQVEKRTITHRAESTEVEHLADEFAKSATRDILKPDLGLSVLDALAQKSQHKRSE